MSALMSVCFLYFSIVQIRYFHRGIFGLCVPSGKPAVANWQSCATEHTTSWCLKKKNPSVLSLSQRKLRSDARSSTIKRLQHCQKMCNTSKDKHWFHAFYSRTESEGKGVRPQITHNPTHSFSWQSVLNTVSSISPAHHRTSNSMCGSNHNGKYIYRTHDNID